jgi:hypothetical protein
MVFISQKFLDTPLFRLIRFRQKVLTVLPPLELFSLERKGRLLPGGLFVCGKQSLVVGSFVVGRWSKQNLPRIRTDFRGHVFVHDLKRSVRIRVDPWQILFFLATED